MWCECMSKARSLIEDPIEVNRERPFAFGKLWENIEVWDTKQQSQWTVYDAWTFYTCLHVAFIQCRSLLCLILLQKCSECLHKLLASLCSTSLYWLSRCLSYDYLYFGGKKNKTKKPFEKWLNSIVCAVHHIEEWNCDQSDKWQLHSIWVDWLIESAPLALQSDINFQYGSDACR